MASEAAMAMASWLVQVKDHSENPEGVLIHEEEKHNLIVDVGRAFTLKDLFVPSITNKFSYMGVGSSSTAAANGDTSLGAEITTTSSPAGSLSARYGVTNTAGATLSATDVVSDTTVSPYREKIVVQVIYQTGDDNGCTFNEFGLFDQSAYGGGDLFNHFILTSSIAKNSSISVTVQCTIRI